MSGPLGKKQEVSNELVTGVLAGGPATTEGGRSRRSGETEAVQHSSDVEQVRDRDFVENKEQSPTESMVTLATDAPFDRPFHCEMVSGGSDLHSLPPCQNMVLTVDRLPWSVADKMVLDRH